MSAPKRTSLPEIYMRLHSLKRLLTLMVVQEISQRRLATEAGYRSHAYMGRILRGEVDTLEPEAALRIAKFLGVGVDDLFVVRLSSDTDTGQSKKRSRAA